MDKNSLKPEKHSTVSANVGQGSTNTDSSNTNTRNHPKDVSTKHRSNDDLEKHSPEFKTTEAGNVRSCQFEPPPPPPDRS